MGPPADSIEAQDGRFGQAFIDLEDWCSEGLQTEDPSSRQAFETIKDFMGFLPEAGDQRGLLP